MTTERTPYRGQRVTVAGRGDGTVSGTRGGGHVDVILDEGSEISVPAEDVTTQD